MSDPTRTYAPDSEVAALIKAAEGTEDPLRILVDGTTFVVRVEREDDVSDTDRWADYDPEEVRAALKTFAGAWSDLDADELKANLYRAREEGSRPVSRP